MANEVLDYIGLNLDNIPNELNSSKPTYNMSKASENNLIYKVYKKISVKSIDILIGAGDRLTSIEERYQTAVPIGQFIEENKEGFTELAKTTTVEKIKALEDLQNSFKDKIPYFVKYDLNYIWQIYYSKEQDKYFMLFPANEGESEVLFYMIKQKLQADDTYIYVPICREDISEKLMPIKQLDDMENYIWAFTREWPQTYEVYEDENPKIYITGIARVQEGLESKYRITINDQKDAEEQYNLLKAIFILTTETKYYYNFNPQIDKKGHLVLAYENKEITLENMQEFVSEETKKQQQIDAELNIDIVKEQKKLDRLKELVKRQKEIYAKQEKQIVMFMECKKSFFKKMKYFFKNNKKFSLYSRNAVKMVNDEFKEVEKRGIEINPDLNSKTAQNYGLSTIADLVKITVEVKELTSIKKGVLSDIKAVQLQQTNMNHKIENAQKYIDEIEEHKKSLLEFWKFTNKDNEKALAEGVEENVEVKKQKSFNFKEDMENFGADVDEMQRKKLSIEECDAIFVTRELLGAINSAVTKSDTYIIEETFENLKENYKDPDNKIENILGRIADDCTTIKVLNNKKHRENKRDIYKVLKYNPTTTMDFFKDQMREMGRLVNEAYQKITSIYDMPIYYTSKNKGYIIGSVNPYDLLKDQSIDKIYKMNANHETHIIYMSNIIFYDNTNQTLPLGMNESSEVILKVGENKKANETSINLLVEDDLFNVKIRNIKIIEEEKRQDNTTPPKDTMIKIM